jgi:ribonuclease P protein component
LAKAGEPPVDDFLGKAPKSLGAVVPKRHARRAVTRSLLKRQIYAAGGRHAGELARGLWIVRLHAPFDRSRYPSAASRALRDDARAELDELFSAASRIAPSP